MLAYAALVADFLVAGILTHADVCLHMLTYAALVADLLVAGFVLL